MTTREDMRSYALDALGLIEASARGDHAAAAAMILTYRDAFELLHLVSALVGHAGNLVKVASEASGIPPAKLLGAVGQAIREIE